MKVKPDLSFWKLWNISFGFFGVQIAYALQSANISRIFSTLGADPHNLSYFWILPPLAGIIVQPIVGAASDKTWTRFGRRIPYLFIGSLVAVLVMCLLPNAGYAVSTVSRALNDHPDVSREAKEKIKAIVAAHKFVPNSNARQLKVQQNRSIIIVVKGAFNMFFAAILERMQSLISCSAWVWP